MMYSGDSMQCWENIYYTTTSNNNVRTCSLIKLKVRYRSDMQKQVTVK